MKRLATLALILLAAGAAAKPLPLRGNIFLPLISYQDATMQIFTGGSGGSGDIATVGDCTSGDCFSGSSGTILTFNHAGGDGTLDYDGTDFSISKPISVTGTIALTSTITFPDNVRQTFNPGADAAGLNVGSIAGDPGTPSNGDLWYDSTANELTARINGSSVALGAGSGIAGSGTLNTIPKFTPDGTTVGNSTITDDATTVTINTNHTFTTTSHILRAATGAGVTFTGPTTDRIYTLPDAAETIATLGQAQTFSAAKTFSSSILAGDNTFQRYGAGASDTNFRHSTGQTPDTFLAGVGVESNSLNFVEVGDTAFDFNNGPCGTAACADPALIVHSSVQDITQYNALFAFGTVGKAVKTLTESSATSVIQIPVASGAGTGGTFTYTVFATDATDHQIRNGSVNFAVVNKAGTETCTLSAASEAADGSVIASSSGTLTYGITCSTSPSNAVDLQLNAVSSLTQTTLEAYYKVELVGPGLPARQ